MSYDAWKTRSPDDELRDADAAPFEDEPTELDEVYGLLDKAKLANSALRASLRDFVVIMEMDIELGHIVPGDTRRTMIEIAKELISKRD